MSYTESDLTAVQTAIINLGTGSRVVQVNFSNGHSVSYSEINIDALKELRSDIQRELSTSTKRFFRTVTSKGL